MQVDFKFAEQVRTDMVQVAGWYPLEVKYGIFRYSHEIYLIWQVVGTSHIFRTALKIVTTHHGSKYKEHFELTLKKFREDLIEWNKLGLPEVWMVNYWKEFKSLIV